MSALFVIPARRGSKRLPGKNLATVDGVPLVRRAVQVATKAARGVDGVVVSTDCERIATVAGCVVVDRPAELAGDTAASIDVLRHAVAQHDRYDYAVLVQPTSPFTTPTHLRAVVDAAEQHGAAYSAVWHHHLLHGDRVGGGWAVTGMAYAIAVRRLATAADLVVGAQPVALAEAWRAVDIDTAEDLAVARALAALDGQRWCGSCGGKAQRAAFLCEGCAVGAACAG